LGADQYLQKSGLLVWHIDETITGMYPAMRSINVNPEFYGVNLLQADGEGSLYTSSGTADSKDPFPGSLGVDFLSGLWTYSYDRDADGSVEAGRDSEIEIKNIVEDSDSLITFTVTNPNQFGRLVRYDKGGPNSIVDFADKVWAGILFTATDTSILSGVKTFIPSSVYSNVSDYKLRIYSGWHNNQPSQLICSVNNNVSWSPLEYREGGWIFISLLDEQIRLNDGEIYYIEFMYNGTGLLYSYDNTKITSSINDKKSYIVFLMSYFSLKE